MTLWPFTNIRLSQITNTINWLLKKFKIPFKFFQKNTIIRSVYNITGEIIWIKQKKTHKISYNILIIL